MGTSEAEREALAAALGAACVLSGAQQQNRYETHMVPAASLESIGDFLVFASSVRELKLTSFQPCVHDSLLFQALDDSFESLC
jgi:hypothetical protein